MSYNVTIAGAIFGVDIDRIQQEINGDEIAIFSIPNDAYARSVVEEDQDVNIFFNNVLIFSGTLAEVEYNEKVLVCTVYDKVYNLMNKRIYSGDHTAGEDADVILAAVCSAAGVSAGSCPSTSIAAQFIRANCYQCVRFLTQTVTTDVNDYEYYSSGGTTINIASRGTARGTIPIINVSRRAVSRSKKRDKVIVRGKDASGADIEGSAGTGDDVIVFVENKASDETTLNNIAQYKLKQVNKDSFGVRLNVGLEFCYNFVPGDTIDIDQPSLALNGTYTIWRITKRKEYAEVEIDKSEDLLERFLERQTNWEEYGIYLAISLDDPAGPPDAPIGVSAVAMREGIKVTWVANTEADLDRYIVYRDVTTDPTTEYARVDTNLFVDMNLTAGLTYYYRITAIDRVGNESDYSTPSVYATVAEFIEAEEIEATFLRKGIQPYSTNLVIVPKSGATHDQIQWAAGAIYFADGTSQSIDAGSTGGALSGVNYVYFEEDDSSLNITSNYSDAISDTKGLIAVVEVSTTASQEILIQPFHNKGLNVNADVIAAQAVLAEHIMAAAVTVTKISDGAVISTKISPSSVQSRHITASQIVAKDFRTDTNVGEAGGPAGIRFTENEIAGYSGGTTKTFYLDANTGKAYAAGGSIVLDDDGLTITGDYLLFKYDSSHQVGVFGNFAIDEMAIVVNKLTIYGQSNIVIKSTGTYVALDGKTYSALMHKHNTRFLASDSLYAFVDLLPLSDKTYDLGSAGSRFAEIHGSGIAGNQIVASKRFNLPQFSGGDPSSSVGDIWFRSDL